MPASEKRVAVRVAGILVRDGRVLLVRHEREGASYWVVPGGHVEEDEPLEVTLKREFREEIGLEVRVEDIVMINDFISPKRHILNLYFSVTESDGASAEPRDTPDGGVSAFRWFDPTEMERIKIRPDIARELARLASGEKLTDIYLGMR